MSEVVAAVEAVVPTDGMIQLDANYLKNVFKLDESQYADCCVMTTNVGTTIDEFGIFQGTDSAQAAELKSRGRGSISSSGSTPGCPSICPRSSRSSRPPSSGAEGDYVMYAILSDDAQTAAGDAFTACFAG